MPSLSVRLRTPSCLVLNGILVANIGLMSERNLLAEADQPANPLLALVEIAKTNYVVGNRVQAREAIDRFLWLAEQEALVQLLRIEYDAAVLCKRQGDTEQAIAVLKRSLAVAERTVGPDHLLVARAWEQLGLFYTETGDYQQALSSFQRCLGIRKNTLVPTSPDLAVSLDNVAFCLTELGNFAAALPPRQHALAINEQALGAQHPKVAVSLDNLAHLYMWQGEFASALPLYARSLAIREKVLADQVIGAAAELTNPNAIQDALEQSAGCTREITSSLCHLANAYGELGDYEEALRYARRSTVMNEEVFGRDHPNTAASLNVEAMVHMRQEHDEQALPLLNRSLAILEEAFGGESPELQSVLNNLALAQKRLGNDAETVSLLEKSLALSEKVAGKDHPVLVTSLLNLASALRDQGKYSAALPFHERSLAIAEKHLGKAHPLTTLAACHLVIWHIKQGEFPNPLFQEGGVLSSWYQYLPSQLPLLSDQESLHFVQRYFFFMEGLHSLCALKLRGAPPSMARFGAEGSALTKALIEEVSAARAALEASPSNSLRARSPTLTDVARSLPFGLALVDIAQYRRWDYDAPTNNWRESRYAAYLTRSTAKDSTNVLVDRVDLGEIGPIDDAIQELSRLIDRRQIAPQRLEPVLQTLGELVWRPMAKYLTNVSHVIVCPDGQLSRLPFEALRDGHKYLLEDKTISYVSSGREIARMVNAVRTGAANPPLVMGNPDFDLDLDKAPFLARKAGRLSDKAETIVSSNDSKGKGSTPLALLARTRSLSRSTGRLRFTSLPDSEQEARSVAQLVGTNAVLRVGAEARETELKAAVSPRVLHLATHGFALPDQEWKPRDPLQEAWQPAQSPYRKFGSDWENPLIRCGIALAGANHASEITNTVIEDGLLTGLEASLLNLQGTELVILSACESGKGDIKTGEGVMSLRRAFTIAGAQTVLASHWRVSDVATRQLMTEFIRRWQSGEPRAKAWREAQLSLLQSKDYSSPYFWAAFTLTGQWR